MGLWGLDGGDPGGSGLGARASSADRRRRQAGAEMRLSQGAKDTEILCDLSGLGEDVFPYRAS